MQNNMTHGLLFKQVLWLTVLLTGLSLAVDSAWGQRAGRWSSRSFKSASTTSVSGTVRRRSSTAVNRTTTVRRNTAVNVNRNTNVNVRGGYSYYDDRYDNDVGVFVAGAVVGGITGAAIANASQPTVVVGSYVNTLPRGCTTIITNDMTYHRCGTVYYRAYYDGPTVVYRVVPSP